MASSFCLALVCLGFAAFYLTHGVTALAGGLLLLGTLQLLTPLLLRSSRSLESAAQLIMGGSFVGLWTAVWFTGGPTSPGLVWGITIPMLGLFLSGWRACLVWTGLSAAVLVGLGVAHGVGVEFPELSRGLPIWFRNLVSNGGLLVCVLGLLAVAEASRRRAQAQLGEANLELARARDAALAQARQKSQFLATVSHEIRTPMNAVIGLSELLLSSPMSSAQRGFLRTIRSSGHELLRLIDDVLSYARNEAEGALPSPLAWVEPNELVDNVLELLAEPAHRKGLELWSLSALPAGARVKADASRLRQVLINLVGNAIKFTEAGEIALRVELVPPEGDRGRIRFEVWDTGVGLADPQLDVFRPFARASLPAQPVEGTGLGLSISKQLVELMGGRIGVQGRPEGGSSFWFELELDVELPRARAAPKSDRAPVLVLEPSAWGQRSLSLALDRIGVPHVVAASLAELPELSRRRGYDAVITRYEGTLPSSPNGVELERALGRREARVIVLARLSQTLDETAESLEGRTTVLGRPVRAQSLESALERPSPSLRAPADSAPCDAARAGGLVLIVDDNSTSRQVLELQLRSLGHQTVQVSSGEAALDAVEAQRFDAVFMDCQMPGIGGVEAIRRLRALEKGPLSRSRIVALTASILDEDWARCRTAGADEILAKPVELAALRRALEPIATASERRAWTA